MIDLPKLQQALEDRQRAYMLVFNTEAGKAVLNDLATFCRANETCIVPGDRDRTYVLEGRREVWLRLRDHLDTRTEDLFQKFTRPAQGAISHERPADPDADPHT